MADSILVTADGAVMDADVPFLYADDLAAVRGDGCFETLLVSDGVTKNVTLHLERLVHSAAELELPTPDVDQWRAAIATGARVFAEQFPDAEGMLRIVYSRGRESAPAGSVDTTAESGLARDLGGATGYLTVKPVAAATARIREEGVTVLTLSRGYPSDLGSYAPWQLIGVKSLSYATNMAAQRHAQSNGFDEVIYLSSDGYVLEGPRSTVVLIRDNELITPDTSLGILPGTTQKALFELAAAEGWTTHTAKVLPADLIAADAVYLVSSVVLATRVTQLNDYQTPVFTAGAQFSDLVRRAVDRD